MNKITDHVISEESSLQEALQKLNNLGEDATIFVVDNKNKLLGSLTDGDIRRALISTNTLDLSLVQISNRRPLVVKSLIEDFYDIIKLRKSGVKIVPIVDENNVILNILNFNDKRNLLPLDVIVLAGGRGQRLRPLTDKIPKPLLKVGGKPIIQYNLDNLVRCGITNFNFILRYLGGQIEEYLENEKEEYYNYRYVYETEALGTIGGASLIDQIYNENVLVTNSDLLTDLDYEDFFLDFIRSNASMSVVCVPYTVKIPYAVLTVEDKSLVGFSEKPTYTYYSSAGIYMVKRSILEELEYNKHRDMTDLMEELIETGHTVNTYFFDSLWIDIGSHEDYEKAQKIITKNI